MQGELTQEAVKAYLVIKRYVGLKGNIQQQYSGAFVREVSGRMFVQFHAVRRAHILICRCSSEDSK